MNVEACPLHLVSIKIWSLVGQVATLLGVDQDIVTGPGRYPDTVEDMGVRPTQLTET